VKSLNLQKFLHGIDNKQLRITIKNSGDMDVS